ncbi:Polycomb protein Su(z)12 [Eumeta japonica]|uniref:Polycomb protein Su(Z)12 n=1 Tax=Eumeta variegata TaxID=151549 RepID=A0A4C1SIM2_EUMVA|nr:Polycomb protein Su(z)12 [Eumeta japonica]
MFLDANGHEIIRKNIYRNFILHMCSLFDYGLVSPETLYKTVQKLQGILSKYREGQELMSKQREAQLKYWLEVGILKQDEQKLKSPQKSLAPTNNTLGQNKDDKITNKTKDEIKNVMQPPTKRSSTAVKRSSVNANMTQNGAVANEKLANGKSVARKSAAQDDEPKKTKPFKTHGNGDKKRIQS